MHQPEIPPELVVPATPPPTPAAVTDLIAQAEVEAAVPDIPDDPNATEVVLCEAPHLFPPGTVLSLRRKPDPTTAKGWRPEVAAMRPVSPSDAKKMYRALHTTFRERLELRNLESLTVAVAACAPGFRRVRMATLSEEPHVEPQPTPNTVSVEEVPS